MKCGAPVGTTGGRCPFCGTEQPKLTTQEPTGAAAVGLSDVNRARMGRPSMQPKKSGNTGLFVVIGALVALALIGGAVAAVMLGKPKTDGPAPSTSVATVSTASPERTIGGVSIADAARVDPTDLLPKMKPRVMAWNADAKLLEIVVVKAKNGYVNATEPGGEIVVRFISEKIDPRAPKGKDVTRQRMHFVVKQGAGEPDQGPGAATDKAAAEPNCVWSAAHRAAVKGGLPLAGPTDARYGWDAKANADVWVITSGAQRVVVDGNSCAIKG